MVYGVALRMIGNALSFASNARSSSIHLPLVFTLAPMPCDDRRLLVLPQNGSLFGRRAQRSDSSALLRTKRVTSGVVTQATRLLNAAAQGDGAPAQEILPLVYQELRRLAAQKMAREPEGQTLQPTALVHEAWLKLSGSSQKWNHRGHFFAAAAEAMRRILIDRARKRKSQRRGHGLQRLNLDDVDVAATADDDTLLSLNEALDKFAAEAPGKAELVKLRYFAGLSIPEAAQALGISEATAKRHWAYARAWLFAELKRTA